MNLTAPWKRFEPRLTVTPLIAVGAAVALVIAGLGLAVRNEDLSKAETARQVSVQAQILADSVAAPLAFDDGAATREYVNALRANPDIEAVGAYDASGRLTAGYGRTGPPPRRLDRAGPPTFVGGDLVVTAQVAQGGSKLGLVYLKSATESWKRRALRYLGITILVVMAAMLVGVLGASYASVSQANRKLQEEIKGRHEAEDALRQSQKMEAMGQLVGGVAHDFNNLLMVASSGLDLLDRATDPVRRERLKQGIRQAVERGANLTQQLLAFARRSPLHPEIVDLAARLFGMRDILERSLREDVVVDFQPAADLWLIEVDPSQLEVAVLNIALNARDAMPNGGVITIRAENLPSTSPGGGDHVRLSISDNGVGMPGEVISKVFEPFFTTKRVGQGTGLGLSQVYGFANSAGGEVRIESVVDVGTTVHMLLPRCLKARAGPAPQPAATIENTTRRCRILVVEDDDHVADLVGEMLNELGCDTVRAPTAALALDRLRLEKAFDLVFSDMVMPGDMNGLDLAHEIARRQPNLPVVLTSGYSAAATRAAAEGIRVLTKPYRIDALADEVKAALSGRGREDCCPPAAG